MSVVDKLTTEQRNVVNHKSGPALVVAVPGAGKTATLTSATIAALQRGVPPERILVVTFSRIAVATFRDRLAKSQMPQAHRVIVTTFHSFARRIAMLDERPRHVLGDAESEDALASAYLKTKIESLAALSFEEARSEIERARLDPDRDVLDVLSPELGQMFKAYEQQKKAAGALDFTDLLREALVKLDKGVQITWPHVVFLDEAQDTNALQLRITEHLVKHAHTLVAVGDPMQAIYGFQGADPAALERFAQSVSPKRFVLSSSFRLPREAANLANHLISIAELDIPMQVVPTRDVHGFVAVSSHLDPIEEAEWVAREAAARAKKHRSVLILARTNADLLPVGSALEALKAHYSIRDRSSFADQPWVAGLLDMARLAMHRHNMLALSRLLSWPKRPMRPPISLARHLLAQGQLDHAKDLFASDDARRIRFDTLVRPVLALPSNAIPRDVYAPLLSNGKWRQLLPANRADQLAPYIESFLATAACAQSFHALLAATQAQSPSDKESHAGIVLSTIHSAKGDEADYVFLVGADGTRIPHPRSCTPAERAEELRLLYVAATRTRDCLVVSWPRQRGTRQTGPSPWVAELIERCHLIDLENGDMLY